MNRAQRRRLRRGGHFSLLGRDELFWLDHRPHVAEARAAEYRGEHIANPKEGKAGRSKADGAPHAQTWGG